VSVPRLRGRGAFAAVIVVFLALVSQSAIPSPFYPIYSQQFHLPPIAVTVVFAVYVAGIIAMLLTVGGLSDHVGRRPVLVAGCLCGVAALVVFLAADGFTALLVARILQGISIGVSNAALAATLVDTAPRGNTRLAAVLAGALPPTGLALGALLGGIAIELAPHPTGAAYSASLIAVVIAGVLVLLLPETRRRRPGALGSLRPRIGIPVASRNAFGSVVGALIAGWAMTGLYLALIPTVLAISWPSTAPLLRELPLSIFLAAAALSGVVLIRVQERFALLTGLAALVAGALLAGAALAMPGVPALLLVVGTVVAGFGFGATFQGSLRYLVAVSDPTDRATIMAAALTIAFAAFGIPSVMAGAFVPAFGIVPVAVTYSAAVLAISAVATAFFVRLSQVAPEEGTDAASSPSGGRSRT
jgi:hypothetical protein